MFPAKLKHMCSRTSISPKPAVVFVPHTDPRDSECAKTADTEGEKRSRVHNKHNPCALPLAEKRGSKHTSQSEVFSCYSGKQPVRAWTGGYLENHLWTELLPLNKGKMKGKDKKWLLIDSHFISLGSDDRAIQSN